jgi:hypothetical protein
MIQRTKVRQEAMARASAAELSDLLLQLQEEFSQLTMWVNSVNLLLL